MGQMWSQTREEDSPEKNHTSQEIITHMRKLVELDTEYRPIIRQCIDLMIVQRMASLKSPEDSSQSLRHADTVKIEGSCSQGGWLCRWFKHGPVEVEVDINNQVGIIFIFHQALRPC